MSLANASGAVTEQPAVIAAARPGPATMSPLRWRSVIAIALTAAIGIAASLSMFSAISSWQARVRELRFGNLARDHLQTINAGLKDATDLLYSMRAYFESLDHPVSRGEYIAFSHSLRERVVGLRDTGWAPRVTAAERDSFERAEQARGATGFEIRERAAGGTLVRAGQRGEYFPIIYSDPGEINRSINGFDLSSEPIRNGVVNRARATDRPAATPPLKLLSMQRPNGGMLSFIAVRHAVRPALPAGVEGSVAEPASAASPDAPAPVAGVILGAFETAPMLENILATRLRFAGLNMYVFDPNGPPGSRLIYWRGAASTAAPDEAAILAMHHWSGTLHLVDQQWSAIFTAPDAADTDVADWSAVASLAAGLIMTGAIVSYLLVSLRATRRLEWLTNSLRQTSNELRRNGAKLDHIARHDPLTGLANRLAFREEVSASLRRVRRGHGLAVLYLDLDRFKSVNDTLGHPAGDRLLCQVAHRLRDAVRDVDTITRLGGDEFAIAQDGADQPGAAEILAARIIETVSRPYDIEGHRVAIGVSVGITPADQSDLDVDQLLRRADMALYEAKRAGRGVWRMFQPEMDQQAQARHGMETDLRNALEHGGLELYYQPLVAISDGRVRGFEALLRWQHPKRGVVLPGDFIRCAEETGLIVPIGIWVLRTAIEQTVSWPRGMRLAVNLSPQQLDQENFAATVEALLAASGQGGERLELEITEASLLPQHAAGMASLERLRALGVQVSLDDFGAGCVSLSHLRHFPFDRIKIDHMFVAGMADGAAGIAVVRAILQLAGSLAITTTVEGVETQAQLEQLAAIGCEEAQGYLFSPPQPASALPRLMVDGPWPRPSGPPYPEPRPATT